MNKQVLKRLLTYTKPYFGFLVLALICAVISVTLSLLVPVLIGDAVDLIIGPGQVDFDGLPMILWWLAGCICLLYTSSTSLTRAAEADALVKVTTRLATTTSASRI